jgi:hypothetical protein
MNKASIAADPGNTHELWVQQVEAGNPSRVLSSPATIDAALGIVLAEGRALLVTRGPARSRQSSGLGKVGKQEPGTQHPRALAAMDAQQNSDGEMPALPPGRSTEPPAAKKRSRKRS